METARRHPASTQDEPPSETSTGTGAAKRQRNRLKTTLAIAALLAAGLSTGAQVRHPNKPGNTGHTHQTKQTMSNKEILQSANEAVSKGDYEGYLAYCTENTDWSFEGEQRLRGKEAVRQYMKRTYLTPPVFSTDKLIATDDYVIAMGHITLPNAEGRSTRYSYCDVWRFENGKMAALNAYVVEDDHGQH